MDDPCSEELPSPVLEQCNQPGRKAHMGYIRFEFWAWGFGLIEEYIGYTEQGRWGLRRDI